MASKKAVITNHAALTLKYEESGAAAIAQALQRLIAADKGRGLMTMIFDISDETQMSAVGAAAVTGPKDEPGAKLAVDLIYEAHIPDYIMLLDGPDVVPHIALDRIAGVTDDDSGTDSDLPYACAASFSRKASAYLAVTRVVGRLPAARGETDETKLIDLIDASTKHASQPAAEFSKYFAITADKWRASTQMSLSAVFGGSSSLFVSPNDGHTGIDGSLSNGAHFINCHGASVDWRFYGEKAGSFPVAMETPAFAAPSVGAGAVVAAECCYGAQLYNYRLSQIHPPLCLTYLWKGASAVMGSTNIAYGPAAGNGQADIITQYFLQEILKGASTGRAMLQARQSFVQNQTMSGHLNLKTLAQFLLLGDPSLHPVIAPTADVLAAGADTSGPAPNFMPKDAADLESGRKIRRIVLASEGKAVASTATRPGRQTRMRLPAVDRFIAAARQQGFKEEAEVFSVTGGAEFRTTAKFLDRPRQVAIVMDTKICVDDEGRELFTSNRAMIGHILGDGVFLIEECESR
ncbi:MAG: C25 family cysteine peptidase [Pseudorhizobium sp.]